jgi:hypothetical protein
VKILADPDETEGLNRWGEIISKGHGYGGVFNHQTDADKRIVELSTCREWCRSMAAEFNLALGEPRLNPDDPPDCYVTIEGRKLGIELVQLVENKHKKRVMKGETPFAGKLFHDMQWTKGRFSSRLNEEVQKKGAKYRNIGKYVDVLLVHTAETWLNSSQAREWLAEIEIERHPSITSAFLLFDYEPGGESRHWPVFWLYGDLSGVRACL